MTMPTIAATATVAKRNNASQLDHNINKLGVENMVVRYEAFSVWNGQGSQHKIHHKCTYRLLRPPRRFRGGRSDLLKRIFLAVPWLAVRCFLIKFNKRFFRILSDAPILFVLASIPPLRSLGSILMLGSPNNSSMIWSVLLRLDFLVLDRCTLSSEELSDNLAALGSEVAAKLRKILFISAAPEDNSEITTYFSAISSLRALWCEFKRWEVNHWQ